MYLLDSSFWISLFLTIDVNNQRANEIMEQISEGSFLVPYCVVAEVCTILTYKGGYNFAENFLQYITRSTKVRLIENKLWSEMSYFMKLKNKISFYDSSIIKVAIDNGCKLITFDKQMKKIYDNAIQFLSTIE